MSFYKLKQPSLAISLLPAPTKTLSSAAACENQEITKNTKKHTKNKQNQQNTKKHVKIIETSEFLADLFSFRVSFCVLVSRDLLVQLPELGIVSGPRDASKKSARQISVFLMYFVFGNADSQIVVFVFFCFWKRVFLDENMFWMCLDTFSFVFHVDLCVCASVVLSFCFLSSSTGMRDISKCKGTQGCRE